METTEEFEIDSLICRLIPLLGKVTDQKDEKTLTMAKKIKELAFKKLDDEVHAFNLRINIVTALMCKEKGNDLKEDDDYDLKNLYEQASEIFLGL